MLNKVIYYAVYIKCRNIFETKYFLKEEMQKTKSCELKKNYIFKFFHNVYTLHGHYNYMFDFGIQVNKDQVQFRYQSKKLKNQFNTGGTLRYLQKPSLTTTTYSNFDLTQWFNHLEGSKFQKSSIFMKIPTLNLEGD